MTASWSTTFRANLTRQCVSLINRRLSQVRVICDIHVDYMQAMRAGATSVLRIP